MRVRSVQVLESKMMEIEHDIAALHAHEKMSRNAVADGEAVLHAEAVEQAEEEAAHEATEADESLLNKQVIFVILLSTASDVFELPHQTPCMRERVIPKAFL